MRNIILLLFPILFFLSKTYSQTYTYSGSGLNQISCNVFNTASPQVINSAEHFPLVGGVSFDGTFLKLQANYGTTSATNYATAFAIKYNIKKGYTYQVKVSAKTASQNSKSTRISTGVLQSLLPPNTQAQCGAADQSAWGSLTTQEVGFVNVPTQSAAQEYIIASFSPANNNAYFFFLVEGVTETEAVVGMISQVVITETAPVTTSFSLTPSTVVKTCGTALNQTFTVNGNNIPSGASVTYNWDLGVSSNRWYYGGSPAPQNISTTSNTLTLTDVSCALAPTDITVTANVNGTNYPAGSVKVTTPGFSIIGPRYVCTNTTSSAYSIQNLGCSPSVAWTVSPASGVVNPNSPNSPTTTLTYVGSGSATLTASYSSACGSGTLSIPITSGSPVPQGVSSYRSNYNSGTTNSISSQYVFLGPDNGNPGDNDVAFNYTALDPLFSSLAWSIVSQPVGTNYQLSNETMWMYATNTCTNCSVAITMNLSGTGPCGTYSQDITSTAARISGYGFSPAIAPNPATSSTTISLVPIASRMLSSARATPSPAQPKPMIKAIQIATQYGAVIKTYEYKSGVSIINISLAGIPSGIYKLSVFDGTNWSSQQLIIK